MDFAKNLWLQVNALVVKTLVNLNDIFFLGNLPSLIILTSCKWACVINHYSLEMQSVLIGLMGVDADLNK